MARLAESADRATARPDGFEWVNDRLVWVDDGSGVEPGAGAETADAIATCNGRSVPRPTTAEGHARAKAFWQQETPPEARERARLFVAYCVPPRNVTARAGAARNRERRPARRAATQQRRRSSTRAGPGGEPPPGEGDESDGEPDPLGRWPYKYTRRGRWVAERSRELDAVVRGVWGA